MKKLTAEWISKAEADLAVVKQIKDAKPPLHDPLCFHCQQAGEKYLKAMLQELGLSIPRTHDLLELVDLLLPHDTTLKSLRRPARSLRKYAVEYRYPGLRATRRQADTAQRHAQELRSTIRSLFGI